MWWFPKSQGYDDTKWVILLETSKYLERKNKKNAPECFVFISFLIFFCLFFFLWRLRNPKSAFFLGKNKQKQKRHKKKRHKLRQSALFLFLFCIFSFLLCLFLFLMWFCWFVFVLFFFHKIDYCPLSNEWRVLDIIIIGVPPVIIQFY